MSDQPKPTRNLSDISHLFLSDVRDRQTNGASRPVRRPPGGRTPQINAPDDRQRGHQPHVPGNVSIDMTPEEFARMYAEETGGSIHEDAPPSEHVASLTYVISAHLNGRQDERVRQYARHLAAEGGRVGLIELDTGELRVSHFERRESSPLQEDDAPACEYFDDAQLRDALEELNWDVDHWLLTTRSPRLLEARPALRGIDRWVLLSTCDHDGVVAGYRMLKGLGDANNNAERARLSVALIDAADDTQATRIHDKLAGVCQQFLNWPVSERLTVLDADGVCEQHVLSCRAIPDAAQGGRGAHWPALEAFVVKTMQAAHAAEAALADQHNPSIPLTNTAKDDVMIERDEHQPADPHWVGDVIVPTPAPAAAESTDRPASPQASAAFGTTIPQTGARRDVAEIIDLSNTADSDEAMLDAILQHAAGEWVECPVRAPMCPEARLMIARDHRLVLMAVVRQGQFPAANIGQAYRWLIENRGLIAMAVPQLAIDAHAMPALRLYVDHHDLSANILQPLLSAGQAQVQAYRKLRWGQKTGLLLEAA